MEYQFLTDILNNDFEKGMRQFSFSYKLNCRVDLVNFLAFWIATSLKGKMNSSTCFVGKFGRRNIKE